MRFPLHRASLSPRMASFLAGLLRGLGRGTAVISRLSGCSSLSPATIAVLVFSTNAIAEDNSAISYPPTRQEKHAVVLHGVSVPDPFRWLETAGAERNAWAKSQDKLTTELLARDPLNTELRSRMKELSRYARAPVPRKAGGRWFIDGQRPGENYTDIRFQSDPEHKAGAEPRLLIDPHRHPASPGNSMAMGPPIPSPDGRYILYGASSASTPSSLRVCEVETGEEFDGDVVPVRYWPWVVSWMHDSSAFLYVDGQTVRLHKLGTASEQDPALFRSPQTDEPPHLAVRASADGTMIFVTAFHPINDTTKVYAHALGSGTGPGSAEWDVFIDEPTGSYQVLGKRRGQVFVYTTLEAPRGRVIAIDLQRPSAEDWTEIIPEQSEPVYDDNHPMRPTVGVFADCIAAMYATEGRLLLRVYDLQGKALHEIQHAELGFTESGIVGSSSEAIVRYDCQSMFDPGTAYEVDLVTGERKVIDRAEVPFDPDDFESVRSAFVSHDGVEVPILLAHKRGIELDGSHAALIDNWCVHGIVPRPLYRPEMHAWIELGGIVAIPAGRGSGEYGEDWHRAGAGQQKIVAIEDLGAAAKWLVAAGYSNPGGVGMLGASMNSSVSAAVLLRHPKSFGAGLIQIPRIDLLAERTWMEEYGDFNVEEDFHKMIEWLPLQNIKKREYPAVLVQVGNKDTVAPPHHGYKLVAALQAAQQAPSPILLQVVWGAGHSQGRGVPRRCETLGLQFTFLARSLNLLSSDD